LLSDLNLYEQDNRALHQPWLRQLEGLTGTKISLMDWVDKGRLRRGAKLTLTFNQDHFTGEGELYHFGVLIAQLLPYCFSETDALQVCLLNQQTQQIWSLSPVFGLKQAI